MLETTLQGIDHIMCELKSGSVASAAAAFWRHLEEHHGVERLKALRDDNDEDSQASEHSEDAEVYEVRVLATQLLENYTSRARLSQ